jgi:hypothetical protein
MRERFVIFITLALLLAGSLILDFRVRSAYRQPAPVVVGFLPLFHPTDSDRPGRGQICLLRVQVRLYRQSPPLAEILCPCRRAPIGARIS